MGLQVKRKVVNVSLLTLSAIRCSSSIGRASKRDGSPVVSFELFAAISAVTEGCEISGRNGTTVTIVPLGEWRIEVMAMPKFGFVRLCV